MAARGSATSSRAAAGGPTMRLNMSSAPTTGTVMAVARATTTRKARSMGRVRSPRASATWGRAEDNRRGRYRKARAIRHPPARAAVGTSWDVLTPSSSPKRRENSWGPYSVVRLKKAAPRASMVTRARAVTVSRRSLRPRRPMVRAAATAKAARPARVLTPMRVAPAAPAKAPLGMAWAGNADERWTTKKPTAPATVATMVAVTHAWAMKPANTALPSPRCQPAPVPVGMAPIHHGAQPHGGQVGDEDHRHDEKAHRQAVDPRQPVGAVVGQEDAQPGGRQPGAGGSGDGHPDALAHPDGDGGGADEEGGGEDGPGGQRRQAHGQRQSHQVAGASEADRHAGGGGDVGVYGRQEKGPVGGRHHGQAGRPESHHQRHGGRRDGEDRSEQHLLGGAGRRGGGVQVQKQGGQADGGAQNDPGGQVPPAAVGAPHQVDGAG